MSTFDEDRLDDLLGELKDALAHACAKHRPMVGPHEGYAVLLEEVDELWAEVKKDGGGRDVAARKEAFQVAAMGLRYILDVCK